MMRYRSKYKEMAVLEVKENSPPQLKQRRGTKKRNKEEAKSGHMIIRTMPKASMPFMFLIIATV